MHECGEDICFSNDSDDFSTIANWFSLDNFTPNQLSSVITRGDPEYPLESSEQSFFGLDMNTLESYYSALREETSEIHTCKRVCYDEASVCGNANIDEFIDYSVDFCNV